MTKHSDLQYNNSIRHNCSAGYATKTLFRSFTSSVCC